MLPAVSYADFLFFARSVVISTRVIKPFSVKQKNNSIHSLSKWDIWIESNHETSIVKNNIINTN
jgi:hypothetical protein